MVVAEGEHADEIDEEAQDADDQELAEAARCRAVPYALEGLECYLDAEEAAICSSLVGTFVRM